MDKEYMTRALTLAKKGEGFAKPNPLVGAVIVKNGRIIGEGYHEQYGEPHAEINAINSACESIEGATMYVTLEPCSHYGKTPPCALALVKGGFKRVVIASKDPNPLVGGNGIQMLKDAGIEVESGLMDEENRALNEIFFHYIEKKRPFVIVKTAMSADGKIATHTFDSKWISNEKSRKFVHTLRNRVSGILVGINTLIKDDPRLNVRLDKDKVSNPIPIILDTKARTPLDANVLKSSVHPLIIVSRHAPEERLRALKQAGAQIIKVPETSHGVDLNFLMDRLGEREIDSLLIEGGSTVNDSAFKAGIVNRYYAFIAPKIIGGKAALSPVGGEGFDTIKESVSLKRESITLYDEDILVVYSVGG